MDPKSDTTPKPNHDGMSTPDEVLARLERTRQEALAHQERFSLAVEGANDGLWDWDLRTGTVYYSPRWKEMLGFADDEIPDRYEVWERLVHPDDLARSLGTIRAYLDGEIPAYVLEHRLRHKDGTYRWILARGALARDTGGRPVRMAGWHTDITDQKRAEEELRARARQQAAVADLGQRALACPDVAPLLDEATALVAATLEVEFASVLELLSDGDRLVYRAGVGWPPEDRGVSTIEAGTGSQSGYSLLTGEAVVLAADLPSETRFAVPSVLRRHGVVSGATVVIHGGEGRPYGSLAVHARERRTFTADDVNFLQAVANVLGAAIARARADEQVREREAEYRAIFEAVTDGLTIVDPETRLVIEVNPAMARMHGYTREEMVGRHPSAWIHPDYHALREEYVSQVVAGGSYLTRAVDVRKDGSTFPVEVRGAGFTYRGRPHLLAVARDVTEQVRAQELLEHRVAALARIAANLTFDQPIEATLEALAADVVGASGAVACAVGLVEEGGNHHRLAGIHGLPEGFRGAAEAVWGTGANLPTIQAASTREPVVLSRFREAALADPAYAPAHDILRAVAWDTIVAVPLIFRGAVVGTLATYYLPEQEPSEEEIAFLAAIADQAAVAVENARLMAAAQDKAVLEERQRLSRELHDSVSHALFDIGLGARTARSWLDRDPRKAAGPLDYVLEMAEAGLAEMRSLLLELRPETLERDGLVAALERQATAMRRRHGLEVAAELGAEPDLAPPVKEAVYRIAREALHNTVKHARAGRVTLRLGEDGSQLQLEVRDDGAGFDPAREYRGHLGLRSMRERAERQGGTLDIESAPGHGTRVCARLPRRPAG